MKNLLFRYNLILRKESILEAKRKRQEENLKNKKRAAGYKNVADRNQHHIKEEKITQRRMEYSVSLDSVTGLTMYDANGNIFFSANQNSILIGSRQSTEFIDMNFIIN